MIARSVPLPGPGVPAGWWPKTAPLAGSQDGFPHDCASSVAGSGSAGSGVHVGSGSNSRVRCCTAHPQSARQGDHPDQGPTWHTEVGMPEGGRKGGRERERGGDALEGERGWPVTWREGGA